MVDQNDERWMRRALKISLLAREAAPNPMVGCVLVDANGKKISEGYTQRYGQAHAEAMALQAAGDKARGSTAYVTLEPCSITGKTPPCADALIHHGVKRVVVAMVDPDKRVFGSGIRRLQDAGVKVDVGLCGSDARRINAAFIKHRDLGMPFVTVKTAMTLDGKISTVAGDSKWITCDVTRKWVHRQLRGRNEAILVGIGTILADNPELTVRLSHPKPSQSPLRVIVDSNLRIPLSAKVVGELARDFRTVIAYVQDTDNKKVDLENAGVRLLKIAGDLRGRVELKQLLECLGNDFKLTNVLVEAGPEICASLFEAGLVDRYYNCVSMKVVGGSSAPGPIGGQGLTNVMDDAVRFGNAAIRRSGSDLVAKCEFGEKV